ncbi:ATP-binding protein [Cronbergia sp. UHCC 0137]|uniref:PAS domain-containing sensor histidine kinase n=1 Tax=Cronbergia sp. UHCC 0137 TaxID=3110239 RepID=UPI002B1F1642|nr:ATP-binding protein [Cronbergia sp. UHCC 0137]MEA5617107.1 ATP-binding protein [Cronbergia sp. UHCC 0137]
MQPQDLHKVFAQSEVARVTRALPQLTAGIIIFFGSLVLLGWVYEIEYLKTLYFSAITIKANTALCLILSGASLWLFNMAVNQRDKKKQPKSFYLLLSRICALVVTIIGLLTATQYLFDWNLGIDQFFLRKSLDIDGTSYSGRMGFDVAWSFILMGIALTILAQKKILQHYWYAQILILIVALIQLQGLIAHTYAVNIFAQTLPSTTFTSLKTTFLLTILCIGILWTYPKQGFMRLVTSDRYSGILCRRLLLGVVVLPFILGSLIIKGKQANLYDPSFALSLFTILLIVIFSALVWQSVAMIEHLSQQRDIADRLLRINEEKLRSFVDANVIGIVFSDIYGTIEQANDEFLRMIGYTQEDLQTKKIGWKEITPPELLYLDEQSITQAKITGACVPYKKEFIRQDGSRVPVLIGYVLLGEQREEAVCFILDLTEQQQAQAKILQLNKNLERRVSELQTLLEVIPVGIAIAEDRECQTIKVNRTFAKQLKISPNGNASLGASEQERPKTFKLYRYGRELSVEEMPMQYCAAHGVEVLGFELDVVFNDGKMANLLEYVAPLFDEEGKTRGAIGAFLDITERKQSEELLRNHQQWLEDVLNLMPMPLLFIEPGTGQVNFANRAANELNGGHFLQGKESEVYPNSDYLTGAVGNLLTGLKPGICNIQSPRMRVAAGEELAGLEVDLHTSQGSRTLLIFADTLPAMHSYPATCVMAFQDVTKLKEVEKALSLGYNRLHLLFNTASSLLSCQKPEELIDSVFEQLAAQIGLDAYFNFLVEEKTGVLQLVSYRGIAEELAQQTECLEFGQSLYASLMQERRAILVENLQQSKKPQTEFLQSIGVTAYYGYPLINQDKLLRIIAFVSCNRVYFSDNQRGMMQAVCDQIAIAMERSSLIASLQRQTEQLQEANRMKDEFLGILSHELRSPLNAILGWAQVLRSRKFSEEMLAQALETIERNARGQTQVVEDLLDISRIIRGKLQLQVRNWDLVSMINAVMETVSLAAQSKEIGLRFSLPNQGSSPPPISNPLFLVSGDRDRLQQIIWNLLTNAIKFTPRGGDIEIKLAKIAIQSQDLMDNHKKQLLITNYAQIQVIDTGIGINPDFLPYVFDRFRQADSSNTRTYGGLGLGLALVRYLVELHGGTVEAESPGHNQGATFTVKLPLLEMGDG